MNILRWAGCIMRREGDDITKIITLNEIEGTKREIDQRRGGCIASREI